MENMGLVGSIPMRFRHLSQGHLSQGHLSQGHLSQGHLSQGHLSQGQFISGQWQAFTARILSRGRKRKFPAQPDRE
jgi:hypothetical protein